MHLGNKKAGWKCPVHDHTVTDSLIYFITAVKYLWLMNIREGKKCSSGPYFSRRESCFSPSEGAVTNDGIVMWDQELTLQKKPEREGGPAISSESIPQ